MRYLDCKISFWPFNRGISPQREIIQAKKYGSAIFDEESIYEISIPNEISIPYELNFFYRRTNGRKEKIKQYEP